MKVFEGTPVKLERSNRKTVSLQILADSKHQVYILIKVPTNIDEQQLVQIVESRRSWIKKSIHKLLTMEKSRSEFLSDYSIKDNGRLPFQGKDLNVQVNLDRSIPKLALYMDTDRICISRNPNYSHYQDELPGLLKEHYTKKAYTVFSELINAYSKTHGFNVNTLRIKDTKTRWGSCSAKLNINLNWRLIMAHKRVYEYVIVHELCHLGCWHHGKPFWNKVESILPDYRVRKNELKRISEFLFAFDFSKLKMNL